MSDARKLEVEAFPDELRKRLRALAVAQDTTLRQLVIDACEREVAGREQRQREDDAAAARAPVRQGRPSWVVPGSMGPDPR